MQNLSWTDLGDNLIILQSDTSKTFHELNEVGGFIWKSLREKKSPEQIATAITAEFDVDLKKAQEDVLNFAQTLKEKDLIEAE